VLVLTELAKLVCPHPPGEVENAPRQDWVTVENKRVLVESDPEGRSISRCPMYGLLIKPCTRTYQVEKGYSELIRIDGHRICLDTVTGLTNGSPAGGASYTVSFAGQGFVSERE
jgi:hypothetical protein